TAVRITDRDQHAMAVVVVADPIAVRQRHRVQAIAQVFELQSSSEAVDQGPNPTRAGALHDDMVAARRGGSREPSFAVEDDDAPVGPAPAPWRDRRQVFFDLAVRLPVADEVRCDAGSSCGPGFPGARKPRLRPPENDAPTVG